MIISTYEDIIKNSKIAYLKITGKKNKDNKYIGINVIEQSKEFERIAKLISGNNLLSEDATEALINNYINKNLKGEINELIENIIKKGSYSLKDKQIKDNKNISINIYNLDSYFLMTCNLEYSADNNSHDIKTYNWTKKLNGEYVKSYKYLHIGDKLVKKSYIKDMIGKKDVELFNNDEVKIFQRNEEEVIKNMNLETFYETFTNSLGKKTYIETTLWPWLNEKNEIIGTKGISIKIDDKLVFERSMQQNEENFREITKYCDSVFIIANKKRATYVSPSFENIFEEKVESLYKDIDKLYSCLGLDMSKDDLWKDCNCSNNSREKTVRVKLDNKLEKWIWYKFLPIKNNNGNIEKYVGILTDVTDKIKLEEETNKSKLDFFANISHELRTPINLISSTIQLVKMNIDKLSYQERINIEKYITIMESNTLRLIKLVNNLLDSSRVDAGYVNCNLINADIIYFIEDICFSAADLVHVNKMNLVFDTNSEEEVILFDPNIVERVMLNLLSNAVKFNKENGTIYVNTIIKENEIEIIVKDEGKGISDENKELIFKRFEQVHNINKEEKSGSGIGLYLVKSLVELHGGSICVDSKLGRGSEFIVKLPKKIYDSHEQSDLTKCKSTYDKINIEFSDI